jgi:4-amino-4-deoxy-L-arabinose transferase-like glycosyltransferase
MKEKGKNELLLLAILASAVFLLNFLKLGDFGVTDPGEGYYVEAAREMVQSGDYITPHLNYQIYFSKPILTFWLISLSYLCLGVSELAARLPFALIAFLLFLTCYYVGRSLNGPRAGLFAALIAATTPLMLAFAKLSPIDIAFTAFLDIALFGACLAALLNKRGWWLAAWTSLALAFLTKGPAALILTFLGFGFFILIERAPWAVQKERLKRLHVLPGIAIFLIIALPWCVAVSQATDGLFLKVFLLYENWARFSGHTNLARVSWYHYLIVILYGFFPWVFLLPSSIRSAFLDKGEAPQNRTVLLMLFLWSTAVFIFFSLSKTHLDTYILPVITPLAVLIGCYLDRSLTRSALAPRPSLGALTAVLAGMALLFLIGPILLIVLQHRYHNFYLDSLPYYFLIVLLGAGGLALGRLLQGGRIQAALLLLFLVIVPADALLSSAAFMSMDNGGQKDLRELCQKLSSETSSHDCVAIFRAFKPSVMFYMKRPVDSFFHPTQMVVSDNGPSSARQFIIVHEKTLPLLVAPEGTRLLLDQKEGQWRVFELKGGRVQSVETLETMFKNPEAFRRAVSGESNWGPLTVPYGGGKFNWSK